MASRQSFRSYEPPDEERTRQLERIEWAAKMLISALDIAGDDISPSELEDRLDHIRVALKGNSAK